MIETTKTHTVVHTKMPSIGLSYQFHYIYRRMEIEKRNKNYLLCNILDTSVHNTVILYDLCFIEKNTNWMFPQFVLNYISEDDVLHCLL